MKIKYRSLVEVHEDGEDLKALSFLTLGSKYLNLVANVLAECIKSGNPHHIISNSPLELGEYFQKTRWSDFIIIEPVLFNFYQGLELTLKGLLFLTSQTGIEPTHGLTALFEKVSGATEILKEAKEIIKEHIIIDGNNNPLIYKFLTTNKKSIDQLYESLRYPTDKSFTNFTMYFDLHYKEKESLEYFKKVIEDIHKLQALCTSFYRDTTKTGFGGVTSI